MSCLDISTATSTPAKPNKVVAVHVALLLLEQTTSLHQQTTSRQSSESWLAAADSIFKKAPSARASKTHGPGQSTTSSSTSFNFTPKSIRRVTNMASQLAARGKQALDEKRYDQAIELYTSAIRDAPSSPEFFIQRATAHTRAKDYAAALDDAEQGVVNAQKRAKREWILQGQLRRGIALYQLGRLGDAEFALTLVKNKLKGEKEEKEYKAVDMWLAKCTQDLAKLDADDEKRKCTITETPIPREKPGNSGGNTSSTATPATKDAPASTASAAPPQTAPDKIRHEWYQSTENVYFTLLAKGVPKDKAHVEITSRSLSISFPLNTGADYDLTFEPLFAAVRAEKCITRILPSKVEVILVKLTPGQKWAALESSEPIAKDTPAGSETDKSDAQVKHAVFAESSTAGAPAYPTSSKNGPKNWDKITAGDDDDDIEGGDETDHFFKKLFKGASPEMQRAMAKSYTESNGTALSTNWDEVSKGKVETLPPSGMEAKEYPK
jgi:suppressor of G2 allele of SKP1